MSTSTSTLINVVNRVLLNNGEREQRQLNTPTSYLARDCIRDALEELSALDDWEWSRDTLIPPFTSWSGNVVTLERLHRLHSVSFKDPVQNLYLGVSFVEEQRFDAQPALPVSQRVPCIYTQLTDTTFKFDVTPTLLESQSYKFYLTRRNEMPVTELTTFNMSEQGIPMLVSAASAKFAQRHTGETGNAQMFRNEMEQQAAGIRNHKRFRPSKPFNIYRGHQ